MSYDRVSHSFRICGSSIVGDLGHVAVVVVDVVVDVLDAAVRESHGVGTLSVTCAITGLSSMSNYGCMVGRGSMNYRGVVSRSSMDHRSSMVDSVDHRSSMVDSMCYRSSMSHNSMRSSMVTS